MSSIAIHDLAHRNELDSQQMSAIQGGSGSAFGKDVNVTVNVNQQLAQFQQIGVNVLNNNGVIGAGFTGPRIDLDAALKGENRLTF
ncbi:hypothetical protein C5614_25705 [Massilia phosphatilytica]|jgi:hypothetical protein|nr:hypothetical protein C5614_25705 [Massilia phosphatilytica]